MRIAEKRDIEELSKLRVLQQKEDWKEDYPEGEDKRLYEVTKKFLIRHLNEDIIFFCRRTRKSYYSYMWLTNHKLYASVCNQWKRRIYL